MTKVQILNPDTMDRVLNYLDIHFDKLDKIIENTKDQVARDEYQRYRDQDQCVSGTFTHELPVRQGYDLIIEAGVVVGLGTATSAIAIAVDTVSQGTLCAISNNTVPLANNPILGTGTDGIGINLNTGPNGVFIPSTSRAFLFGSGWDSASPVGFTLQLKYLERTNYDHVLRHVNTGQG